MANEDNITELDQLLAQVKLLMDENLAREAQEEEKQGDGPCYVDIQTTGTFLHFPRPLVSMLTILSCAYPVFEGLRNILL